MQKININEKNSISLVKINMTTIALAFLGIFLYLEIVAPHSRISQIWMVPTVIVTFFVGVFCNSDDFRIKIKINPLIVTYFLFLCYQIVLVLTKESFNSAASISTIITGFICLISLFCSYNFLYNKVPIKKFETMFIVVALLSSLTVLYLCRDTLGQGRMAHVYREGVSYYFLGEPVSITSNGLASLWSIGVYFILNNLKDKKVFIKIILVMITIILIISIILSGSRKGLLILFLSIFFSAFLNGKKGFLFKLIISLIAILGIYLVVTSVPIFKNIIGERLELLVNNLLFDSEETEGSMYARQYYENNGWNSFYAAKVFGHGVGWFSSEYGNITEIDYLETLVSGGIIGFIIYYSFIPIAIILYFRKRTNDIVSTKKYLFLFFIILLIMTGAVTMFTRQYLLYLSLVFYSFKEPETLKE